MILRAFLSAIRYFMIFPLLPLLMPVMPANAGELTLEQAVRMALASNRQLMADAYELDAASRQVDMATASMLPRLDLGYVVSRTDSPLNAFGTKLLQGRITARDFNPAFLNHPSAVNNHQPRVTLSLPVYQGGALYAGRDAALAGSEAARHRHAWLRQQIILKTVMLFSQLQNAQAQVAATKKALAAAEENLKSAKAMQHRGLLIAADVMDAEVHRLNVEVRLNRLRNLRDQAEDALRRHLGMEQHAEVLVHGDVRVSLDGVELDHVDDLVKQAVGRREDVLAFQERLRAARAGIDRARSGFLPHLSVQASREWNRQTPGFQNGNTTVAAVLEMNVFAGGADRAALDRARAEHARLSMLLLDLQQQVANEVRDAWRTLNETLKRKQAMNTAFEQARESLRIERLRFKQGLEKTSDLLAAQSRADQAEAASIQAKFDVEVARARMLLAVGLLDEERIQ